VDDEQLLEEKVRQPLPARLASKVWKVRQEALDELLQLASSAPPGDPNF